MKIALGSEVMPDDDAPAAAGSSGGADAAPKAEAVEAEVVGDGTDPWGKKQ